MTGELLRHLQDHDNSSLLGRAKAFERDLQPFLHRAPGDMSAHLFTPWFHENIAAEMAIEAEQEEVEMNEPLEKSSNFWKKYEKRYGSLSEMIVQGEIWLEILLEGGDEQQIEDFAHQIETEADINLEPVENQAGEIDQVEIGMATPFYTRVYKLAIR